MKKVFETRPKITPEEFEEFYQAIPSAVRKALTSTEEQNTDFTHAGKTPRLNPNCFFGVVSDCLEKQENTNNPINTHKLLMCGTDFALAYSLFMALKAHPKLLSDLFLLLSLDGEAHKILQNAIFQ